MSDVFYRIVNPIEEPKGVILTSNRQSKFRQDVFAYRRLIHDIYKYSTFVIKKTILIGRSVYILLRLTF